MVCVSDAAMDEFSFLPSQAEALGVPVPAARRVSHRLADGRTVSALQYGDAPGVTFLHGAGLNAHTWDTTVLALGVPALVLDLPGHGDSSWREDATYTGATLADDIAPALAAWTDRPQLVVGHSLGGLTAAALAARHPELVSALVLVDISPGIDPNGAAASVRAFFAGPTDWASRDDLVERALSFGLGGTREAATRGVFLNSRVREDGRVEWKHHYAHLANRLAADPGAAEAVDAQQRAGAGILSASGWEHLAAVTAPVTLVVGARGFLTDADRDEFARRMPQARIITLDSAHNVQEERPRELADVVRDARDGL
ncbi:alpha/beta hydrolase [Microbacterium sp. EYE_5]|uniref:alpha/beta fold hydrolase n=1 Tax=unclassified Microbacterium TaxID=2609290 RepID=UPI002006CC07|nr:MULTISPECIES: alpha/beta hydrolase [unclassified Microbacterium]MCK6081439.1 alpha/beta hydrolase [Microbacterium sp. EYE_382]MCK6086709.1 alpha/beta hydrolase [Microbacterium sp. EYE_384]MCK6123793.1 alpha/beta hydrolase [Microbacterium sp. EYE_80]MCK6126702.1 alpha/beta hydrolase [Microbacterium sp. EYE_79]MCK6142394.1 alpha/beta hydrolase [Microbacterium sp. EYE_39]